MANRKKMTVSGLKDITDKDKILNVDGSMTNVNPNNLNTLPTSNIGTSSAGDTTAVANNTPKVDDNMGDVLTQFKKFLDSQGGQSYNMGSLGYDKNTALANIDSAVNQQRMDREGVISNKQNLYGQVENQYADALGKLKIQQDEMAPQYQALRDESFLGTLQGLRNIDEVMANRGMAGGGRNLQAQLQERVAGEDKFNRINLQEQQALRRLDEQRNQLMRDKVQSLNEIDRAIELLESQGIEKDTALQQKLRNELKEREMELNKALIELNEGNRLQNIKDFQTFRDMSEGDIDTIRAREQEDYGMVLSPQAREIMGQYEQLSQADLERLSEFSDDYAKRIQELERTDPANPDIAKLRAMRMRKVLGEPELRERYGQQFGFESEYVTDSARQAYQQRFENVIKRLEDESKLEGVRWETKEKEEDYYKTLEETAKIIAETEYKEQQTETEKERTEKTKYEAVIKEIESANLPQEIEIRLKQESAELLNIKADTKSKDALTYQRNTSAALNKANKSLAEARKQQVKEGKSADTYDDWYKRLNKATKDAFAVKEVETRGAGKDLKFRDTGRFNISDVRPELKDEDGKILTDWSGNALTGPSDKDQFIDFLRGQAMSAVQLQDDEGIRAILDVGMQYGITNEDLGTDKAEGPVPYTEDTPLIVPIRR